MAQEDSPRTTSSTYTSMSLYWRMVSDILCGVEAMRSSGMQNYRSSVAGPAIPVANLSQLNAHRRGRSGAESPYLPQFPNEDNEDYDIRRKHAPLTNIYSDISFNLSSKPFSKTCELDPKSADDLKTLAQNIDGQGNNLHVFASILFKAGIDYAIDWIWVDYPKITNAPTLAAERAQGARPYWVRIPATRLLAVYSDFVQGQEIFVHARIYEPQLVREGYGEKLVEYVRVLNRVPIVDPLTNKVKNYQPATWELFEKQSTKEGSKTKDTWISVDSGSISIGVIPLVPFFTGPRTGGSWDIEPPLKNIVHMQIEEFQQESNLKTTKELTAFPMLAGNGVSPTGPDGQVVEIAVGPHAVLFAPPPINGGSPGNWSFIEPSATSLTFLKNDLEAIRTEMRDLGMQPLASANLTVITTANVSLKANSQVQAWALRLKDSLEQAWYLTCRWLNRNEQPVVKVHTDFGVELEAGNELTSLQGARTNKDISRRTFWDELKRRGVLSDDFDPDIEDERLAEEQDELTGEQEIDPATGKVIPMTPRLVG